MERGGGKGYCIVLLVVYDWQTVDIVLFCPLGNCPEIFHWYRWYDKDYDDHNDAVAMDAVNAVDAVDNISQLWL